MTPEQIERVHFASQYYQAHPWVLWMKMVCAGGAFLIILPLAIAFLIGEPFSKWGPRLLVLFALTAFVGCTQ